MSPLFWKKTPSWDAKNESYDVPVEQQNSLIQEEEIGQLALDVLENHDGIYILAPIAAVELSDMNISIHETTLSISGQRMKPKEFFEYGISIKNQECFWGKFQRNIILPDSVDFSSIKATMEGHLLIITIPKLRFSWQKITIET